MTMSVKFDAVLDDIAVYRLNGAENCVLSLSFIADPDDNNDLLSAMSMLMLLEKRATFEIFAKEINDQPV